MAHEDENGNLVDCPPHQTTDQDYYRHLKRLVDRGFTLEEISLKTGRHLLWLKSILAKGSHDDKELNHSQ